jgi:hypothetical protein
MAIFDHERKNGIQMGTVGDECMQCRINHRGEEDYEPQSLDYKPVYKIWVNNMSRCLCLDCFKESLGQYVLIDSKELEDDKPKAAKKAIANAKAKKDDKKEADKDGSETA